MNYTELDQVIFKKINEILTSVQLSPEMLEMITFSLNADYKSGERFKWAQLTIMSCECVGGLPERALPGAVAMELFAVAADIFDDIEDQDNDELPWRKLSNANALNLALGLLMLSYEAVSTLPSARLFREVSTILSRTGLTASNGQFLEFLCDGWAQISLNQYFDIIEKKSGSLAACACKIGAKLAGASETLVLQLGQFGTNLGIMSQIRNDLSDFLDFANKRDFLNKKKTLPSVYLLNMLKEEKAEKFKELMQTADKRPPELQGELRDFLGRIAVEEGIVPFCLVMHETFRQKAAYIIEALPVTDHQKEKMSKRVEKSIF